MQRPPIRPRGWFPEPRGFWAIPERPGSAPPSGQGPPTPGWPGSQCQEAAGLPRESCWAELSIFGTFQRSYVTVSSSKTLFPQYGPGDPALGCLF